MGKKDKKKQGLGAAKTAAKTAAKAARRAKKAAAAAAAAATGQDSTGDGGASISQYQRSRPLGRTASCFVSVGDGRVLMIGGERFIGGIRGDGVEYFGGVWEYDVVGKKWVGEVLEDSGSRGPGRRSAAQGVFYEGGVWMFGGESLGGLGTLEGSSGQEWVHWGDLWRLDVKKMKWKRIGIGEAGTKGKGRSGGPGGRSGHRLAVTEGGLLVLFGGYYDVGGGGGSSLRYFDDLWCLDLTVRIVEMEWRKVDIPGPSPRSGFSFANVSGFGVFLYGGYSVGRSGEGGLTVARGVMKEAWKLNVAGRKGKEWGWELLGKGSSKGYGMRSRCGISMVTYRNKLYAFGGVEDDVRSVTEGVQGIGVTPKRESKFFSDIFEWSWKKQRWYPAIIGSTDLETKDTVDEPQSEDEESEKNGDSAFPCGRFSSSAVVVGSTLIVYGGIIEKGDLDIVLDDMWSIDLAKSEGWVELEPLSKGVRDALGADPDDFLSETETENSWETYRTIQQEQDELDQLLLELEIGSESERRDYEGDSAPNEAEDPASVLEKISERKVRLMENLGSGSGRGEGEEGWDSWTPRVGEDLRTFFARSREHWMQEVGEEKEGSEKEIRALAFQWAKKRFEDVKPTVRSLELLDSQEKRFVEEMKRSTQEKSSGNG